MFVCVCACDTPSLPLSCPSPRPVLPRCSFWSGLQPRWLVSCVCEPMAVHRVTHSHCPQEAGSEASFFRFCSLGISCPCPDCSVENLGQEPLLEPVGSHSPCLGHQGPGLQDFPKVWVTCADEMLLLAQRTFDSQSQAVGKGLPFNSPSTW